MDAYHFTKGPTLKEFSERAKFHGVKLKKESEKLNSKGIKIDIKYFERNYNGQKITVAIPILDFNCELSFNTLRQLCNQLQIPMKYFAFQI